MKFRNIFVIALLSALLLTGCGKQNPDNVQAALPEEAVTLDSLFPVEEASITTIVDEPEESSPSAATPRQFFVTLEGTYTYKTDDSEGVLVIAKDPDGNGMAVDDYIGGEESNYRFLAYDSYCDEIQGNTVFMKYPETVYSDGDVVYSYYLFIAGDNSIDVYYSRDSFDQTEYLYTATKQN
jgi:hypothetical protein